MFIYVRRSTVAVEQLTCKHYIQSLIHDIAFSLNHAHEFRRYDNLK